MGFDYENYLLQELHSDKVVVLSEQLFAKNGEYEPNKIYVITKYLASSIEFGAETQPVQILILSEQNGLQEAKDIFDTFTQTHNWRAGTFVDNTTTPPTTMFIKQQYSSPVVMSNFNEAAYGMRSVLYVSATLFIMKNVSDVSNLKIMGINIKPLLFNWSYQMSGNTQPLGGDIIASTVKNMATFQASLSIPVLNNYISTTALDTIDGGEEAVTQQEGTITVDVINGYDIVASIVGGQIKSINQETGVISYISGGSATIGYDYKCYNLLVILLKISNGELTGNKNISLTFDVFDIEFEYVCKLTSLQFTSTPNDVPTMQMGLLR